MIQIVGEAARMVSADTKEAHLVIPWYEIIGMRHRLVHEYFHVNLDSVWEVIQNDLPRLVEQLLSIVPANDEKN